MSTPPPSTATPHQHVAGRDGWHLIWRQLRRAPREFGLGLAGTVVFAIATVVSSIVIGDVTDRLLLPAAESGDVGRSALALGAVAILGVSGVKAVGVVLRRGGAYAAQYRLQHTDRRELTERYLQLPTEWHRRRPTGQLLANVNDDVEAASFIAAPLPMAVGVAVMLIVTAVLLVQTDPFLALVGFVVGPLLAGANYAYQRRMSVIAALAQRTRAEVSSAAHESFDTALVIKTLGREAAEVEQFGARSDELRDQMIEIGRIRAAFNPVMEALPNVGILIVLLVGARQVAAGAITTGELVAFAYLFRLVALPMRIFGFLLGELPRAVVGLRRIEAVLNSEDRLHYGSVEQLPTAPAGRGVGAVAHGVTYRHPLGQVTDLLSGDDTPLVDRGDDDDGEDGARGLSALDLDVPAGSTVAVVGPTGSGKTTVAHLLARLIEPQDGRVAVEESPLASLSRAALSDTIVLAFQEAFLFDDTVLGNLTLGVAHDQADIERAVRIARADRFIAALPDGYQTDLGERGATLSGGQRQRIALARALLRNPRLLLLDDATSAIDPAIERDILEGLSRLDTTILLVAYRRSSVALADVVVYVEQGRAVARGTHEELYATVAEYRALMDAYDRPAAA